MQISNNYNNFSFEGITRIRSFTDPHLDTRKSRKILSDVFKEQKTDDVLVLNCGDLYKGVYPRELERDGYLKLKDAKPDVEIVMTIGNNDFGFSKPDLKFMIDSIKAFTQKGIKVVCANIFDAEGKRPDWLKPYSVVERDGDKTLVAGFCVNNINTAKFGIFAKPQETVMSEIAEAVRKEKPDNVVFLNHDFMPTSQYLVNLAKKLGFKVDAVIGGHDHDLVLPDKDLHIYYPQAFSESMYKFNLENFDGRKDLTGLKEVMSKDLDVVPSLENDILKYENEVGLYEPIVPKVLNLTKEYSKPCPLGSFLADEIKSKTSSDISFFSTGFLMKPMPFVENESVTKYSFLKSMAAENPIKIVELSSSEIKEVFQHALRNYENGASNPKFLQASNNVKIEGGNNGEFWEVKQIFVDGKALLDENSQPIKSSKKYKCAIDSYLAGGGQGYSVLQNAEKTDALNILGEPLRINDVLLDGLKEAPKKYGMGSSYPCYEIV